MTGGGVPDDALLRTLASGEASAADRRGAASELFDRWHGKVHAWCRKILGDEDLAADLAQEVFVELLRNAPKYSERGRFGAWIYVIARNRCLNERKRRARFAEEELGDVFTGRVAEDDPGDVAGRREIEDRVRQVCERHLTPLEQEVIWLRYHWGMKVGEMTDYLGLENRSGARTHLRTAEKKLRRKLAELRSGLS